VNDAGHVVPRDQKVAPATHFALPVADQIALPGQGLVQVTQLPARLDAELEIGQQRLDEHAASAFGF